VQGYLREVRNEDVFPLDWAEKKQALPYIDILKANESEMEKLTGQSDIKEGAKILSGMGCEGSGDHFGKQRLGDLFRRYFLRYPEHTKQQK
jgi:hypothetical protein